MASIEVNSENVLKACEKAIKTFERKTKKEKARYEKERDLLIKSGDLVGARMPETYLTEINKITAIKRLAEYFMSISIDQEDFALIGEYLIIIPGKD